MDKQEKSSDEKMLPAVGESHPDTRNCTDDRGEEDSSSSAKQSIERIGGPAGDSGTTEVGRSEDESMNQIPTVRCGS